MNARLRQSVIEAEAVLAETAQERLADLVEAFTTNHCLDPKAAFTPDELREIERIAAEPFVPADPAEVRAFFARE